MILQALTGYYNRLAGRPEPVVPAYGYSFERITYCIVLRPEGDPVNVDALGTTDSKGRHQAQWLAVPKDPLQERTSNVLPMFLWDKTSYALGVTAKPARRTQKEHLAFRELHLHWLDGVDDYALKALLAFLQGWSPDHFSHPPFRTEMLDSNVVFRIDGEVRFVHEGFAARSLWKTMLQQRALSRGTCLVTANADYISRTHPKLRGVLGAQTSGAALSSADEDNTAFHSYGKVQGEVGPVGATATFAYTTALNHLLRRSEHNRQRVQIGDATTVFWAEATEDQGSAADVAEDIFATLLDPPTDEQEVARLRSVLQNIANGRPLEDVSPDLNAETRMFVLGLAPNAARISIRFWHVDTFGTLAERFCRHWRNLEIEPRPWTTAPAIWQLLLETAAQRKRENIPPNLAGEVMRSILTGRPYPRTLFSEIVMRCRADRNLNGMRAAILKAYLVRQGKETPVSLDRSETNAGYRLGRLFAVLEGVQRAALGNVNATIRDRYYGAASATPAAVFPILIRTSGHHISSLRKGDRIGLGQWFEREISEIMSGMATKLPRNLRVEDQGRFAIGYYHEREALYRRKGSDAPSDLVDADLAETEED